MNAHYLLPTEPDNMLKYAKNEGYGGLEVKAVLSNVARSFCFNALAKVSISCRFWCLRDVLMVGNAVFGVLATLECRMGEC